MRGLLVLTFLWLVAQLGSFLFDMKGSRPVAHPDERQVATVIERWPTPTRRLAHQMIARYGTPDGVVENQIWWNPEGEGQAAIVLCRDSTGGGPPISF